MRKRAAGQFAAATLDSPYYRPTSLFGDPLFIHNPPPSSQVLMALAADVNELKRQKVQSMQDKLRCYHHHVQITFSLRGHVGIFDPNVAVLHNYYGILVYKIPAWSINQS